MMSAFADAVVFGPPHMRVFFTDQRYYSHDIGKSGLQQSKDTSADQ